MMYGPAGGGAWMMVLGVVFWLAVLSLVVWAIYRFAGPGNQSVLPPAKDADSETPLQILERRYAAGEIDAETFDEARARIREDIH